MADANPTFKLWENLDRSCDHMHEFSLLKQSWPMISNSAVITLKEEGKIKDGETYGQKST